MFSQLCPLPRLRGRGEQSLHKVFHWDADGENMDWIEEMQGGSTTTGIRNQELSARIAKGDMDAIVLLVAPLLKKFYRTCLNLMKGNKEDAEDIMSQFLLKIITDLPLYIENINNVSAWLHSVCYNLCMDVHRQRRLELDQLQRLRRHVQTMEKYAAPPEEHVFFYEMLDYILHSIDTLPNRLKQAARLRFLTDAEYLEIALALKIKTPNARKRVQEARVHIVLGMRAHLQDESL